MWDNVIGHSDQKRLLKGYISSNKLPHAFLFAGPLGVGKTEVAREFFKAINCLETPGDPCDGCRNCLKVKGETHPDLISIGATTGWIQIKDIRGVIHDIGLKPFEARVRFIIIEPAERLNKSSSNAILKTLEEPPQKTVIILVSHKPTMLLPTIVSRCQVIRFTPVDASSGSKRTIDPVLIRLTSGSVGGLSDFDEGEILDIRTGIMDIVRGTGPFGLTSRYFPTANQGREVFPLFIALIESVLRDILVLLHGGERIVNEELKEVPIKHISLQDIDDIEYCIHGIRKGSDENINLKTACSELLIMLGDMLATK